MPERTPWAGKTRSASCTLRGLSRGDRGRCASCSSRRAGTSSPRPASSWAWARSRSPPPWARGQHLSLGSDRVDPAGHHPQQPAVMVAELPGQRLLQDALLCAHGPAGQLRQHGGVALPGEQHLNRTILVSTAVAGGQPRPLAPAGLGDDACYGRVLADAAGRNGYPPFIENPCGLPI
jgi:hypothetical protein